MVTIKEILDELRIPYKSHGESGMVSHGWVGTSCPWCDEGRGNPGLGFPLQGYVASCWKCGPHTLAKALMKLSGKDFPVIKGMLNGLAAPPEDHKDCSGRLLLPPGVGELAGVHKKYLHNRGFKHEELSRLWGVQGIGVSGFMHSWSLYVPIHRHGKVVSWLTRKVSNHGRRYHAAPPHMEEVHHKRLLYGMDFVRNACVVVEGVTKVWRGGPGFVASFGTGWTQVQLAELSKVPVRAILFDDGLEAQQRARDLARALEPFPGETHVVELESAPQLDLALKEEVAEVRKTFLGE
jgi:hypothetical protein